jgi:hypothetical protein
MRNGLESSKTTALTTHQRRRKESYNLTEAMCSELLVLGGRTPYKTLHLPTKVAYSVMSIPSLLK